MLHHHDLLALLLLAVVMYQSIHQIGGSWAGEGITIGVSIIVAMLLGMPAPSATQILQTIVVVVLIFGVMAFMSHRHHRAPRIHLSKPVRPDIDQTMGTQESGIRDPGIHDQLKNREEVSV